MSARNHAYNNNINRSPMVVSIRGTFVAVTISLRRALLGNTRWDEDVWLFVYIDNAVQADHGGLEVKGMNCPRPLEHWDHGFESHLRHGSLSMFILCLCCPV
jgi:hypothetical protein